MLAAASLLAADMAYSAVEFLPPTRDTRLFRQTVIPKCDIPTLPNVCRFRFLRVKDNRLLELSTVACVVVGSNGFILAKTATPNNEAILATNVAFFLPEETSAGGEVIAVGSPYYFTEGELVVIWSGTTDPESPLNKCTIYGKISRTD